MIDTIVLSIPHDKVRMLRMEADGVSGWDLHSKAPAYEKYVKNPSTKDKESGLYFPRLTGFKRRNGALAWEKNIKIEFSAPKLIFWNNVDELEDAHFDRVVSELADRLYRMGVVVQTNDLRNAEVRSVHYSKNIDLTNGYTSQYVIGELNKINLNKRFDLTRARYMNDGQSLCAYCVAHSFVIYDKIADLIKGKRRAIDKDLTLYQMSLFEPLVKREQPREILRFEVRLSQKQKMNSLFKKIGFAKNPTFKDVFSTSKSKSIVNHYWETMLCGNSTTLFAHSLTTKNLIRQVLLAHRKMKPKEVLYRAGLLWAVREDNGMRELRTILSRRANDRTWYRIANDIRETSNAINKLQPREWYEQIRKALELFQALRLGPSPPHP